MCGEKPFFLFAPSLTAGSPPHVRGKGLFQEVAHRQERITPACAGKRRRRRKLQRSSQDHPRMCGEKKKKFNIGNGLCGSPPHVRGKEELIDRVNISIRITPACAGKSTRWRAGRTYTKDHPRMCGEKVTVFFRSANCQGSPPHVRGKGLHSNTQLPVKGITPACAGKSPAAIPVHWPRRDHPRMCGEKLSRLKWAALCQGSPPHVRGKEKR